MATVNWQLARSKILIDSESCNLNCGSFGPCPRIVWEECQHLRHELARQPMNFFLRMVPERLKIARKALSAHIDFNHKNLIFSSNVTVAINMIASSYNLGGGDVILTTDLEYGAMRWVWERIQQKTGCSIETVEIPHLCENPNEIIAIFEPLLRSPVKLLFFSHVTSPTGMVLPARELCRLAGSRGIDSIVDGAHSVGTLNLSLCDINADFYGGNLHKWLGSPTGSAFFGCKPKAMDLLEPLIVSWGFQKPFGLEQDDDDGLGSTPNIRKLEFTGTIDPSPWLVTPVAIDFQNGLGMDQIFNRQRELIHYTRERLAPLNWLVPATPVSRETSCAMLAFQVKLPIQLDRLRRFLWENQRVEIGLNQHPRLGLLLRVSCHFFTQESEKDLKCFIVTS